MTKTTPDAYAKLPIPRRQLNATRSESVTSKRALLYAVLFCTSALGGCATYIPPEIRFLPMSFRGIPWARSRKTF